MYGKFLLVLVAVFAAVQGLQKKNDERQQKIDECKERWHKTKDDLWDLWDEKTWCETKDTRDLSECFLGAYNAWVDNALDFTPAANKWEEGSQKYNDAKECFELADKEDQEYKACKLLICCKERGLGDKERKRDRRSIFSF